jgi:hypothetical protein
VYAPAHVVGCRDRRTPRIVLWSAHATPRHDAAALAQTKAMQSRHLRARCKAHATTRGIRPGMRRSNKRGGRQRTRGQRDRTATPLLWPIARLTCVHAMMVAWKQKHGYLRLSAAATVVPASSACFRWFQGSRMPRVLRSTVRPRDSRCWQLDLRRWRKKHENYCHARTRHAKQCVSRQLQQLLVRTRSFQTATRRRRTHVHDHKALGRDGPHPRWFQKSSLKPPGVANHLARALPPKRAACTVHKVPAVAR